MPSPTGKAYVADAAAGEIDVYSAPPVTALPATATAKPATSLGHTTATVNGHIDNRDDPQVNDCHFDYVTDAQFGIDAFASATSVPCAQAGPFTSPADVSAPLTGLQPRRHLPLPPAHHRPRQR